MEKLNQKTILIVVIFTIIAIGLVWLNFSERIKIILFPEKPLSQEQVAKNLLEEEKKERKEKNDINKARGLLNEALSEDPLNNEIKYFLAVNLLEEASLKRNYEGKADTVSINRAESLVNDILAVDQSYAPARVLLGNIYENKGDYQKALEEYEKALAIKKSASALFYKARLKELDGKYKEAEDLYNQALEIEPTGSKTAIIVLKLSQMAWLNQNNTFVAETGAKRVLELTDDFYLKAEAYHMLANLALAQNKNELALEYINKALEIYPNWSRALLVRGEAELRTMRLLGIQPALDDWQKAIEIDPNFTLAYK